MPAVEVPLEMPIVRAGSPVVIEEGVMVEAAAGVVWVCMLCGMPEPTSAEAGVEEGLDTVDWGRFTCGGWATTLRLTEA